MIFPPTIHLNGTSRERLLEQCTDASQAIRAAIEAVGAMNPNGRDYYPQGDGALGKALDEHLVRLRKLEEIRVELVHLACAIADAP